MVTEADLQQLRLTIFLRLRSSSQAYSCGEPRINVAPAILP
jgi:hypothetical protein